MSSILFQYDPRREAASPKPTPKPRGLPAAPQPRGLPAATGKPAAPKPALAQPTAGHPSTDGGAKEEEENVSTLLSC